MNEELSDEDYTHAALMGVPVFCTGRVYKKANREITFNSVKEQYIIILKNGIYISIVEFYDRELSSGEKYELYSDYTDDVERGNDTYMYRRLNELESIKKND